ncbi:unnamed protein product [Rangifer tarandus platyrhynchus]|uniref:Uncharacterized protein n=1 Tax=Rangifer tarandus platyrhynchus TaxID=3082113 RepID=A0AC59ZXN6_RANTA
MAWKQSVPGGRHDKCRGPDPRMNLVFDGLKDDQNWNMVSQCRVKKDLGRTLPQPDDRRPARDAGRCGPEAAGSWRRGAGREAASPAATAAVPRLGGP